MKNEDKLIALLARTDLDGSGERGAEDVLKGRINWDRLRKRSIDEGVACLVYSHLERYGGRISPRITESLKGLYYGTLLRNEELYKETKRIADILGAHGIETIALKGALFAKDVYGDIALRQSSDIDLLIKEEKLAAANDALVRSGYDKPANFEDFAKTPSYANAIFYRSSGGADFCIHLHRHIVNSTWPIDRLVKKIKMERFWASSRRSDTSVDGNVMVLSPEHLLLYLCLHGFGHGFNRLILATDILETLKRYGGNLDWGMIRAEAAELGLSSILRYSLIIASRRLGFEVPQLEKMTPGKTSLFDRAAHSFMRKGMCLYALSYAVLLAEEDGIYRKLRFLGRTIAPSRHVVGHNIGLPADEVKPSHYYRRISK